MPFALHDGSTLARGVPPQEFHSDSIRRMKRGEARPSAHGEQIAQPSPLKAWLDRVALS